MTANDISLPVIAFTLIESLVQGPRSRSTPSPRLLLLAQTYFHSLLLTSANLHRSLALARPLRPSLLRASLESEVDESLRLGPPHARRAEKAASAPRLMAHLYFACFYTYTILNFSTSAPVAQTPSPPPR